MVVARVDERDEDGSVLTSLDDPLLTFWHGPLYKICPGRRAASESTPYGCLRSYEMSCLALLPLVRLLAIPSFFISMCTRDFFPFYPISCENTSKRGFMEYFAFNSH